jgi:5-methyltetrahydrofolate--homocysteine methyltransferase
MAREAWLHNLGLKPEFRTETVWYEHNKVAFLSDIQIPKFDASAKYFVQHLNQIKEAVKLSAGRFPICIPDILENLDILALLRGNEACCYDLMDEPEMVTRYLDAIADIYMDYYIPFYDAVKFGENGKECMYTAFGIWGRDMVAKIQCDFSCLMSPNQFEEFVIPYLKKQTEEIPYTMYHLDGKDAIKHLPAVLRLKKLNALQWTPGAGQPDGGSECWYPIYDVVMEADKSIWVGLEDGTAEEMAKKAEKIAKRYDNKGIYFFVLPTIKEKDKKFFTDIFGEGDDN